MSQTINVNGESINYPETGDTNWGDEATQFAIQTSAALGKIGLSSGTTVDVASTLDVTGATTLDSTLTVAGATTLNGTANLNGNTNLGNAITDTIAVTGIVNVDSGTLYVDPTNNRVGINKTNPAQALDVVGNSAISGNETVGGTFGVTGDVSVNTNKFNVTASSGNTSIAGTLGVTGDITTSGILTASNSANVTTAPPITFTGDTNTGIGHSAADTLDYVTGGVSRARLNSTGQQSSVVPDLSGSNTTLYNEYKCRAWVNFNGTTASPSTIRGSGNVSSVTKNGTGDYTINFTTAIADENYSIIGSGGTLATSGISDICISRVSNVSGSCRIETVRGSSNTKTDFSYIGIGIFR